MNFKDMDSLIRYDVIEQEQLKNIKNKYMKNYIDINGKKIKLSDESIANFKKELNAGLTFEDILESREGKGYYIHSDGRITTVSDINNTGFTSIMNIVNTRQRALQLQAITKLMIVADYFNDEAEVYANVNGKDMFGLIYDIDKEISITCTSGISPGTIIFERRVDALQAIKILGEDTIKLALTGH